MIGKLILIQIIIVQIIDISDFVPTMKRKLWKWLKGKDTPYREFSMKPFDCSYCLNFWISLVFLIITGNISLAFLTIVLLLSWATPYTKEIQYLIGDTIQKIINKMEDTLTE